MIDYFYLASIVRRALLICSLLIASCCALFAQADGLAGPPVTESRMGRGESVDREVKQLTLRLNLTEAQERRVKALLKKQKREVDVVRESMQSELSVPDAKREMVDEICDLTDTKIVALLDQRQKAKFAVWKEERKIAMQRRRQQVFEPNPAPRSGQ